MLLRRRSQKAEMLKNVPVLSSLSRRHLDLIARHADEVKVEAGKVLARQGRLGLEFFLPPPYALCLQLSPPHQLLQA